MVLVYETEFENGDVVTKGYDVATGEIAPLATIPTELPDELPVPDSTGETRALIQNKNPSKEETEVLTGPTLVGPDPGVPPTATATTLDLSASSTVSNETNLGTATAPTVNLDVAEVLGEMDLVISPFVPEAGSTSSVIIE